MPRKVTVSGNIEWPLIKCSGYDVDGLGHKQYHHISGKPCGCEGSPHGKAVFSKCTEVALLGGSGAGKTSDLIGAIFRGNPADWSLGYLGDATYVNDPDYKFLVACGSNYQADSLFRLVGEVAVKAGAWADRATLHIGFPSGAEGWFCSLPDGDSHFKHEGGSFTRVFIDGAHLIETEVDYLRAFVGICRTPSNKLHPQIWLTAMPGYVGSDWINRRFRYPHGGTEPIPYGKQYECPYSNLSRVAFHFTVDDNPYFLQGNDTHRKTLNDLLKVDPVLYSHRVLGDFDAVQE